MGDAAGSPMPRRFRWTLGRRLNLLLLVVSPLPLAALLVVGSSIYEARLEREMEQRLAARAKDSGLELYRRLIDLADVLRLVGARPDGGMESLADGWSDRFRRIVRLPVDRSPFDTELALRAVAPAAPPWRRRLEAGESSLVERSGEGSPAELWLAVRSGPLEEGAIWGEIRLDWLWTTGALPSEGGVHWHLFGSRGRTTIASAPEPPPEVAKELARAAPAGVGGARFRAADGVSWRARCVAIPVAYDFGHEGLVVAVAEIDRLGSEAALLRRTSWLVALATLLFAALVVRRQLRRQLQPLADLLDATGKLGAGDLSARATVGGAADLAQLGSAFNETAGELERSFHLLEAGSEVALAALDESPVAEAAAVAFLDRMTTLAPPGIELIVALRQARELTTWIRAGSGREREGAELVRELGLTGSELESSGWVEGAAPSVAHSGDDVRPSIWKALRRGDRTFGAIGVLGYTGRPDERRFLELLDRPGVQLGLAISRVRLIEDLDRAHWSTLTALARAVDAKSPWTRGHSERVTGISVAIGERLGLSSTELKKLRRGALLHDVGKIGVPSAVLDKAGPLTRDEIDLLRSHVDKGVRILEPMEWFHDSMSIVAQHHERLDGSGYPRGLSGAEIDPLASLVAVADVFEALSAARPYRASRAPEFALGFLRRQEGVAFDAACVRALEEATYDAESWPYPELAPTAAATAAADSKKDRPGLDASWSGNEVAAPALALDVPPSLQQRF